MNTCDDTFAGCRGITSLTLPDGITSIGESVFEGECKGGMGSGREREDEGVGEVDWLSEWSVMGIV